MSSNAAGPSKIFYGWLIALVAGLGTASSVGIFIPATIGLLIAPLAAEFHWTAKEIFLAPAFATTSTILVAPFMGAIIDKLGPRRVITVSFLIEALIMASFRYLDDSLWLFYARYLAFALLATGTTHVAFTTLVSRWFDRWASHWPDSVSAVCSGRWSPTPCSSRSAGAMRFQSWR